MKHQAALRTLKNKLEGIRAEYVSNSKSLLIAQESVDRHSTKVAQAIEDYAEVVEAINALGGDAVNDLLS